MGEVERGMVRIEEVDCAARPSTGTRVDDEGDAVSLYFWSLATAAAVQRASTYREYMMNDGG